MMNFHSLYITQNIVRVIKSRRMKWVGYVAPWGRGEVFIEFLLGGANVRGHWEDLGVCESITLKST